MMQTLAETATSDMVSLGSLGAFISGLGALAMTFLKRESLKNQGRKEAQENNVNLTGQPISVKMEEHFVTRREFDRLEKITEQMRRDMSEQYKDLMTAGGERESRLAEKLDGIARGIHSRIDKILSNEKP